MDEAEMLERASRYRSLADRIMDEQTRQGLLDVAEKYEALAKEMRSGRLPEIARRPADDG